MFTEMATISALGTIIKQGGELSAQQKEWLENGVPEGALAQEDPTANVLEQGIVLKDPWCPWFTCCY